MADVAGGLRDDLAAAIAETEGDPNAVEVTEEEKPSAAERPRGPDGKFVTKDAAEGDAEPAAAQAEETPAAEAPAEPEAAPEAPEANANAEAIGKMPISEAEKKVLLALPKEPQDLVLKKLKDADAFVTKKTAELADFRKAYEPVDQMFAPFRAQMRQGGWTEAALIKAWADVEQELMKGNGADVVARIVRDYKLDPQAVLAKLGVASAGPSGAAATASAGQAQPQFDPQVEALLNDKVSKLTAPLQEQLRALNAEYTGRVQAAQNAEIQKATQTVQSFIDAKDAKGNLLHPHYAEVENDMVALARVEHQSGRVPDLQAIYDKAVWANTSTREKLLATQEAAKAAKAQEEARAKAAAAKKASTSVTGAPGAGTPPKTVSKGDRSLRETLEEAAAEHEAA